MDRLLPVQDHRIALHGGTYMITLAAITWRPVDIVLIAVIAAVIAGAVPCCPPQKEGFILLRRLLQM